MNKKIIGYKLIKPEYVNAVISITGISVYGNPVEFINNYFNNPFTINGDFIKALKEAGVLDLWFEPIYEKEVIPEYVECITSASENYTLGRIYKVDENNYVLDNKGRDLTKYNNTSKYHSKFKPSTKEAYDAQNQPKEKDWSKATPEELLAEAKRRYPIGTTYMTPHSRFSYTVEKQDFSYVKGQYIYGEPLKRCLFDTNKWAEIIGKTEIKTEQIFTKEQEDYIKNLINNEIKKLQ